jgi:amino acid transporter
MEKKFKILRIVAFIWKILAWVILVISTLGGCGALVATLMAGNQLARQSRAMGLDVLGAAGGIVIALIAILVGVFYFISLYAVAEMIDVVLALEENTRATTEELKRITKV